MRRLKLIFCFGVLFPASYACSSDDPAGGAAACNTLVNDGPTVSLMGSSSTAPAPAGGTVVDGVYVLAGATLFGSTTVPATTFSAVIQISGKTMQQVGKINAEEKRYTSTFSTTGTSVTTMDTCPAPSTGMHQFTATATELRIYDANAVGTLEQRYAKR